MSKENNLPKLADLHYDREAAIQKDKLKLLLNQKPPAAWIKKHPFAKDDKKQPVKFLSIAQTEALLDRIFQFWRVEVINYQALFNSITVHVRLHYQNPLTQEWEYQDGLGAVGVQVDKGTNASDLGSIKHDAVMKGLPAAKSFAIKDAAHELGELFGRNLNRDFEYQFMPMYDNKPKTSVEKQRVLDYIAGIKNLADLDDFAHGPTAARYEKDPEISQAIKDRYNEL